MEIVKKPPVCVVKQPPVTYHILHWILDFTRRIASRRYTSIGRQRRPMRQRSSFHSSANDLFVTSSAKAASSTERMHRLLNQIHHA